LVKKAKSTKKDNPELLSREASRRPKAFWIPYRHSHFSLKRLWIKRQLNRAALWRFLNKDRVKSA